MSTKVRGYHSKKWITNFVQRCHAECKVCVASGKICTGAFISRSITAAKGFLAVTRTPAFRAALELIDIGSESQ